MAASSSTAASTSTSTSTSVSPNNTSTSPFDVFINHRGPDVKNTFASHLYHRLTSYGLNVFLDREELRQGEHFDRQIKEAIRTAFIHVAIFSPTYAESTWCLEELVMMLESRSKIIPVFYQVKPAELRWTRGKDGVYAQALQKLGEKTVYEAQTERNVFSIECWKNLLRWIYDPQSRQKKLRHNPDTIDRWRYALSNVADISGFELEGCNSDEGLLLHEVVESVLRNMNKLLDVAKYPTGLEEKVSDFENQVLLQHPQRGRKVQVVGIVGLGGVGKTTLAKDLFNSKSFRYAGSCFLDNVRENVVKGSLITLQRRLLRSLTGSDLQIENKDEAIHMLKKHLSSHKILLVLDDVDTVDQVDELVPHRTCIHSDSLILITSRDKDVLTRAGVENSLIYKLDGLGKERSLELFCQYAFGQHDPLPEFENLAQDFVNACDGLPLSLKVFGTLLHGNNDLSYWSAQLVQLQKRLHEDIKARLRIGFEMAASSSTAASTSTSVSPNDTSTSFFDVFINHRGPDVKNTFASHLYYRLTSCGLKVFLDREELQQGEYFNYQIEEAIRTASVHVAIFSARYAESPWCLNELVSMMESRGKIIPVFYQVKPADLKWTQGKDGVYAQALQKLGEKTVFEAQCDPQSRQKKLRHNPATIDRWRNALSKVAGISGFELEGCNSDEALLLRKVVESVLRNVNKSLDVAKYPTGLEEKVSDFENQVLLQHPQSERKVRVVGIVGLGGVGKTTLAKYLFNRELSSGYAGSCFLDDVRENVVKGSLITLQRKLLRSLTGSDLQIENKAEAIPMLKKHLSSHKILLVLDDVDTVDQVDELVPDRACIHSDSLILITARGKDVLTRAGVENSLIYKLDGLGKEHSLELFCQHAFGHHDPLPEFENLAQDFVNACDGLPLSLKVFGALVHGNHNLSYWSAQLVQLQKRPHEDIKRRLRISYEALNEEEKQVFLDIACFFIGQNKDVAISIWDVSKWGGWLAFQNLQNKCLAEVDRWNRIRMHVHLRELGICEASVSQPLRFFHFDDLLQQSMKITVRGIRMVLSEYHDADELDDIQMARLHLVDTEGSLLERIQLSAKHPNLVWLRWKKCPYSFLLPLIPMQNLRFLEVSGDKLKTLWQDESQVPVRLEELRVDGCVRLKKICGLAQLTKLHQLDVSGCSQLDELPNMELLTSLEHLRANGCAKLKNIRGLEQATKLQVLDVSGCPQLDELPSMELLTSLEELSADECARLKSIRGLEQATRLRYLYLSGCSQLDELPNMELLTSLEHLRAEGCAKLKNIRGLEQATKLRVLDVSGALS